MLRTFSRALPHTFAMPSLGGLLGLITVGMDSPVYKITGPHAGLGLAFQPSRTPEDPGRDPGLHAPWCSPTSLRHTAVLIPPRAALEAL